MACSKCLILKAEAMRAVLGEDAVVATAEQAPCTSLDEYGLFGFGSGVYYGRMHRVLFDWLRGLPDAPKPVRPAFVFSTSGLPLLVRAWHSLTFSPFLDPSGMEGFASCQDD